MTKVDGQRIKERIQTLRAERLLKSGGLAVFTYANPVTPLRIFVTTTNE
jgi:hypothetical protein